MIKLYIVNGHIRGSDSRWLPRTTLEAYGMKGESLDYVSVIYYNRANNGRTSNKIYWCHWSTSLNYRFKLLFFGHDSSKTCNQIMSLFNKLYLLIFKYVLQLIFDLIEVCNHRFPIFSRREEGGKMMDELRWFIDELRWKD